VLDRELARRAREDEEAKRLMTIPGIGPITATALVALAPAAQAFKRGRDFAAWLGLTPPAALHGREAEARRDLPHGRTNLAPTADHRSERDRALGNAQGLDHTAVACALPMLVIVALANKMARIAWALMARGETYRAPEMAK
jgi:transposase